jgi:hypothetical protein
VEARQYRIVCLIHRADGHVKALGYSHPANSGGHEGTWTITEARQVIAAGHRLYIVNPRSGAEAELELAADGQIRTKAPQGRFATLADLPACRRS